MSQTIERLLNILADGQYHSGEELGRVLGVSRSAVWKQLKQLDEFQLPLESSSGRGYCLSGGLELLDEQSICSQLSEQSQEQLTALDIQFSIPSTNTYLLDKTRSEMLSGYVCLAEQQTAGRGRNNRIWLSPFGRNIYCSFAWVFPGGAAKLAGLSLAVGVAAVQALEKYNVAGLTLKWPNDILLNSRKLGGVLVEVFGDSSGPCQAIIGIGINLDLPNQLGGVIEQPWVDLRSVIATLPERNKIAGLLIDSLMQTVQAFQANGLACVMPGWKKHDALNAQQIILQQNHGDVYGIARGITAHGELQVEINGKLQTFHSGEVSVRAV